MVGKLGETSENPRVGLEASINHLPYRIQPSLDSISHNLWESYGFLCVNCAVHQISKICQNLFKNYKKLNMGAYL